MKKPHVLPVMASDVNVNWHSVNNSHSSICRVAVKDEIRPAACTGKTSLNANKAAAELSLNMPT